MGIFNGFQQLICTTYYWNSIGANLIYFASRSMSICVCMNMLKLIERKSDFGFLLNNPVTDVNMIKQTKVTYIVNVIKQQVNVIKQQVNVIKQQMNVIKRTKVTYIVKLI